MASLDTTYDAAGNLLTKIDVHAGITGLEAAKISSLTPLIFPTGETTKGFPYTPRRRRTTGNRIPTGRAHFIATASATLPHVPHGKLRQQEMRVDAQLIESLLLEAEGNSLDFKEAQYPFSGATDEQKSELLKDVLAFANAFRRADAYILLGVQEIKGKRAKVVGVSEHLDDAHMQQFVSSKTQRPVTFSYIATEHDGLPIGVIHVPTQPRPLYAVRRYGKVQKDVVYHRRGSSTAVATPEEIAQMGAVDATPSGEVSPVLELSVVDSVNHTGVAAPIKIDSNLLDIPPAKEIPDYGEKNRYGVAATLNLDRPDYWRDLATFVRKIERVRPLRFAVRNEGSVVALDVRLTIEIADPTNKYYVIGGGDMPGPPPRTNSPMDFHTPRGILNTDVRVERREDSWQIKCEFGKIQPHARVVLSDDLYIGAKQSGELELHCRLFADNLSEPIVRVINLSFDVSNRKVTLDEIEKIEHRRFTSSSEHRRFLANYRSEE